MSGEHTRPNPDNSELKKPLQRDDLMGPSVHADNPDYQDAKERYTRQLEAILSTPLVPENFNTYAEDALNSVVSMVEDMTITYPGESLPLPRGRAEEHTARHYEMDIDQILDSLQDKVDATKRIKEFVSDISEENTITVPTQSRLLSIQKGSGEYVKKETAPKLETILFFLEETYDLYINKPSEIRVTKGSVKKDMVRKEPYCLVELPTLNRSILVCNEVENITYVMDNTELNIQGIQLNEILNLNKSEIGHIITSNPDTGVRIRHTSKYIPKIKLAIESIQNFTTKTEAGIDQDTEIVEESLLTPVLDKAPEGYFSVRQIAKNLGFSDKTIRNTIISLGNRLSPIKAKFSGNIANAYSAEDFEMIKKAAEENELFADEAMEGYMSIRQIAKELEVSYKTVQKIIGELGDEIMPTRAKFSGNVTNAYSPEDFRKIREKIGSSRLK